MTTLHRAFWSRTWTIPIPLSNGPPNPLKIVKNFKIFKTIWTLFFFEEHIVIVCLGEAGFSFAKINYWLNFFPKVLSNIVKYKHRTISFSYKLTMIKSLGLRFCFVLQNKEIDASNECPSSQQYICLDTIYDLMQLFMFMLSVWIIDPSKYISNILLTKFHWVLIVLL